MRVKYNTKLTLNAEIVIYGALVLACEYVIPIKNNII